MKLQKTSKDMKLKIIESNEKYFVFRWKMRGFPIIVRKYKSTDAFADIRLDSSCAKALGFQNVDSMVASLIGTEMAMKVFNGLLPEWLRINGTSHIIFFANEVIYNNQK